ncbi:hypothetical protein [Streptomyces sp. NPDC059224]|uniref:hypothetical protein n=1 Tax=Streptomyces sp. NPDC059224 TaxID=3346775 RepID=UPI003680FD10
MRALLMEMGEHLVVLAAGLDQPARDAGGDVVLARGADASAARVQLETLQQDVGEPRVFTPEDTSKCRCNDIHRFLSITPGDLNWLRDDVLEPLNRTIEKSAGAQDAAGFVNLYDSSGTAIAPNRPARSHRRANRRG